MSKKTQTQRDNSKTITIILILFIVGIVTYPGLILISFIILVPTLAALLADVSPNYSLSFCVGICNLASSLPCFRVLYNNRFSLESVYQIIHDPFMLFSVLVGSGIGWLIYLGVPPLTTSYYRKQDQSNLKKLAAKHAELKESWGDIIPESEVFANLAKPIDDQSHTQ